MFGCPGIAMVGARRGGCICRVAMFAEIQDLFGRYGASGSEQEVWMIGFELVEGSVA